MHRLRALGLAALGIALPALAFAQGTSGASTAAAPTSSASVAPVPRPAAGYGYGSPRREAAKAPRARIGGSGPVATLPGFEMMPDGGSRLFVELTRTVAVEEKKAAGTITYVLKGAHIDKRNNANALVTVHFNTPVTRARLVPSGRDLHFVIDLRQNAVPTWKLAPAKDGASILQIDFAKGDFLPAGGEPLVTPLPAAQPTTPASTTRPPPSPAPSTPSTPSTPSSESGPKPAP
jgi:hypothetical protein